MALHIYGIIEKYSIDYTFIVISYKTNYEDMYLIMDILQKCWSHAIFPHVFKTNDTKILIIFNSK